MFIAEAFNQDYRKSIKKISHKKCSRITFQKPFSLEFRVSIRRGDVMRPRRASFVCPRRHEISGLSRSIKISFFCHLNYRRVLGRATRRNIKIPNDFYYSFPIHVASPPRNDVRLTFRILRIHSVRLRRVYTAIKSFKFDTEKPRDELLLYSVNCPNRNLPVNVEV